MTFDDQRRITGARDSRHLVVPLQALCMTLVPQPRKIDIDDLVRVSLRM